MLGIRLRRWLPEKRACSAELRAILINLTKPPSRLA
jgi:hypothetical protein